MVVRLMSEEKIIEEYNKGINAVIGLVKELNSTISDLDKKVENLTNDNEKVKSKLEELEARLNKNSSNSSKPPSTDGYKKKPITNSRKKSDKRSGGQPGHSGVTLEKVENPDNVIEITTYDYCGCEAVI